jgi:hypothetical protein
MLPGLRRRMSSTPITDPERLDVAVRAWAVPDYLKHIPKSDTREYRDLGPSEWALVFDTETLTDLSLRLRVGAYQLRRRGELKKTGLFADVETLSPAELELTRGYACANRHRFLTRTEFVEQILLPYTHQHRALMVGFNLPFDISRIAINHGPAKGKRMRGGFSFTISPRPDAPHIQIKRAGARAYFIQYTIPVGRNAEARNRQRGGDMAPPRGYPVDVGTIAGALLGKRYTLARLCEVLGTEHRKLEIDGHGGSITEEYLDYLRLDVQVTWECFEDLRDCYLSLGLTETPLWRIYSEASVGKALLREIGLTPWRRLQPDVPDGLLATIMETYYGGRSECAIRKTTVAGSYVDFSSEYPLCFVLMNLWDFLAAPGIAWEREDAAHVNTMLEQLTSEQVLDPEFWPGLSALVRIVPDEDRLPTRARYKKHAAAQLNVAVPFRSDGPAQWYTLADACASKLETGKAPHVLEVIRFRPKPGRQQSLRAVDFGGDRRYRIDPNSDDPIKRLVELRATVRADQQQANELGETNQAARLKGTELAMKATANSVSYGTPIELNVIEHRRPVGVTVHLPDGTSYHTTSKRIEEPGEWFHPLIGTLVSGAGRLLLATLMALVREKGGSYAFCDTDSLFITGLEHAEVDEIIAQFELLNPYDRELIPGSILKLEEDENFDPETGARRFPICLGIATKRTAQFCFDQHGRPHLVGAPSKRRRSEHGLGHLRLPEDSEHGTAPTLDEWWEQTICDELGIDRDEPAWFDHEAIGTRTVTSPHDDNAFNAFNSRRPYQDRVRPGNFHNIAHPSRIERSRRGVRCLISQYETDPAIYRNNDWYDRGDPNRRAFRLTTNELETADDIVAVQTFRDYYNDHRLHTDGKMLDHADGKPCHPWTRGPLAPRHVTATRLIRVGKESNALAEDGPSDETDGLAFEYVERCCPGCGTPVGGRRKWCSEACRKRVARRDSRSG